MEVILVDDVFELGKRGEVVRVADGYGRNYLIPKKLAIPSTPGNLKTIEAQRLSMAKKEAIYQEEAELLAQELNKLHVVVSRKSGDAGTLFGSVTTKDIASLLASTGIQLDRRKIILAQPLKSIGNYRIQIRPHSTVSAELLLSVLIESGKPVARVKTKDAESDSIIADLDALLREAEQEAAAETEEPPVPAETAEQEAAAETDEPPVPAETA
ncbi:MAG: 50S ribosomal protein L9, partial [Acidobacteriota bacterium]|nr:50S ribosomal protein L9 [Acidobacteriota bacterium]